MEVKELTEAREVQLILEYWFSRTNEELLKMGVDILKFPSKDQLQATLESQMQASYKLKTVHYILWVLDGTPIGHSSLTKIKYGEDACMHLHVWGPSNRQRGLGSKFVHLSLEHYFSCFNFKRVLCEPNAYNEAPNNALKRAGFTFLETVVTVPGLINFEQPVNRYEMTKETFYSSYLSLLHL